jgi:hypothetical protein
LPSIKARVMMTKRRRAWFVSAGLGLALVGGCQTWVPTAGLTLPSPRYLQHAPQYFPESPGFPLPRELNSLEEAAMQPAGGPAPPLPRNIP